MVSFTSSVALLAAAALVVAQNGTTIIISPVNGNGGNGTGTSPVNVNVGPIDIDINFTINLPFLGPTGVVDLPYVISAHCPNGGCPTTAPTDLTPYGFQSTTTICTLCGPKPTLVTVYSCPPQVTPAACNGGAYCNTGLVVYTPVPTCNTCPTPYATTVTHVYPATTPIVTYVTPCPSTIKTVPVTPYATKPVPIPTPAVYTGAAVANRAGAAAGFVMAGAAVAALL